LYASLKPTTIPPNGTESGYFFSPLGEYRNVQAVLGDTEAWSRFVYAETFQPKGVLLGCVPDKVCSFDSPLRLIIFSEIDQICAPGAEDVHPKA
jgi:hypothetical protein